MTRKATVKSTEPPRPSEGSVQRNPGALEAALGTLRFRCEVVSEKSFSGDWNLDIAEGRPAVYLISEGSGWMAASDQTPSLFSERDIVFNFPGILLRFSDSSFGSHQRSGPTHRVSAPFGTVRIVTLELQPDGPVQHPLLRGLPTLMKSSSRGAGTETTLARLMTCVISESRASIPAIPLIQDRLAGALVLEALRVCLSSSDELDSTWLKALSDPEIAPVLEAILRAPEQEWSVATLAECGSMSRSTFARRFQTVLGCGPMDFLLDVRMRKAADLVRQRDVDLKTVARAIGYRSTAAFSASFKRWCGLTPSDFRQSETGNSLRT